MGFEIGLVMIAAYGIAVVVYQQVYHGFEFIKIAGDIPGADNGINLLAPEYRQRICNRRRLRVRIADQADFCRHVYMLSERPPSTGTM